MPKIPKTYDANNLTLTPQENEFKIRFTLLECSENPIQEYLEKTNELVQLTKPIKKTLKQYINLEKRYPNLELKEFIEFMRLGKELRRYYNRRYGK